MAVHIYIVEDDKNIREIEMFALKNSGYAVEEFENAKSFFSKTAEKVPDLVLLDIMLPDMDGLEIVKKLRSRPDTVRIPIILVTAKTTELDKVKGLDIGADDYLTKPFGVMELISRVKALLRRSRALQDDKQLVIGDITLDSERREVHVGGELCELTFKEFELLTYFLENEGIALSREKILNSVWNYDSFGDARTIDTHVKKLRSKMGDKGEYIKTVWGMGYKFEVGE